jgi:pectinesterase
MSASLAGPLGAQEQGATPPPPRRLAVRAENPMAVPRQDETIAVPWAAVVQQLAAAHPDRVRVVDAAGREVTSQVVDNDGDSRPDELIFLADFWPREAKAFAVEVAAPTIKPTPRVHVRHDEPRDDIAWESDRIAFRIYGEGLKRTPSAMSSSGIDVWPKRVRALVVEKWYAKGHDAYHVDTGEGADFFDVGETLGAGGTAVWRGDTIYRADNFKSYRVLADGPIRAIVELRYAPWDAAGLSVSETKRIAIDAGQNLYRQESVFRADRVSEVPYVIGVVKRPAMVATMSKAQPWAWLTGWGPVAPKNGGHGELGTAVLLPRERVVDWKEAHNHYVAVSRATPGQPVVHYIGAGWTASGDFPTPQAWWGYLDRFAQRLAAPIKVTAGASTAGAR